MSGRTDNDLAYRLLCAVGWASDLCLVAVGVLALTVAVMRGR